MARLKLGAAHVVDHRQAQRRRRAGVDARERLGRELRLGALLEAKPAQANLHAPRHQRRQRPPRRLGHAHADGAEHRAQRRQPLLDVARAQQLLGRAPPQIERLRRRRRLRRLEIHRRRLGAASGVGQRVAAPDAQIAPVAVAQKPERQAVAVQLRRAIERERARRLDRRLRRVLGRARPLARLAPMQRQRLGIGELRGLERQRQPPMLHALALLLDVGQHRRAHAIVIRLDEVGRARPGRAHQVRHAQ